MPSVGSGASIGLFGKVLFVLFGVAMASKIAKADNRATEKVIRSAEARAELFCRFFICLLEMNYVGCSSGAACATRMKPKRVEF